jgi:beta-N-acetylhexosaminidase
VAPAVSLETKIGQMLMVGFRGLRLDASNPVGAAIVAGQLGNVVLFDADLAGAPSRNIESPEQLTALTNDIRSLAPVRPLIAADQEGGRVARLGPQNGFPATVSAAYLGAQGDPELTRRYAGEMAATLAGAGINLNLAPVVDVNTNPANPVIGQAGRSFSADPEVVTAHAKAFIEAHHAAGVLCTLKHFPGHGSSTADSHLGFVDVSQTWSEIELTPYRELIAAGQADVIMTAHVFNEGLDPTYPATLSERTLNGLLRGELGYDGVVMTDDMLMGAISQNYGFAEAVELAVNAGADILAISNNAAVYQGDAHVAAFDVLMTAVAAGRVSESRIDSAYRRIEALKRRLTN